jgi:hypothetical protein
MPGDVSKQEKERMLEGRSEILTGTGRKKKNVGKVYKDMVRMKERAVLKERTRTMIRNDLDD